MKKRMKRKNQENNKRKRVELKRNASLSLESTSSDLEETFVFSQKSLRPMKEVSTKFYLDGFVSLQDSTLKRIKLLVKSAKEDKYTDDHKFKTLLGSILTLEEEEHISDIYVLKDNISSFLSILTDHRIALENLIGIKSLDIFKYSEMRNEYDRETSLAKVAITNAVSNAFSQMKQNVDHKKMLRKLTKAVNLALLSVE
ncbi:hypothetical protein PORY_002758 [Pneumocystis oryctolagi]|uniref:Uncharacterized protein n=1 Tax=Pneumocystis oryctolagi TaxID=42067 RepID=A0ACB7CFW5_9ASCO|nr:hypothetical protein PORY_002758 [Pneumocystis oryctolagi]